MWNIEPEYFVTLSDGRLQCRLCPHACVLESGQSGICRARSNRGGKAELPFCGDISSLAMDPVEKKPLRHFMPGTWTFSVGFWHCDMKCPFCQNWQISHPVRTYPARVPPRDLIARAKSSGSPSISFTYSEPTIHIEYVKACMRLARETSLKTILVTNGNILETPARDILSLTDATNVDLKTSSARIYHEILGGELKVVEKFIQIAAEQCHVEVTSLLVPGVLDSPGQMEQIASFLSTISRDIPLHITSYHPDYHWEEAPLGRDQVGKIAEPALARLKYVHVSGREFFRSSPIDMK